MNNENTEKLARRWPALFQKAGDFEFSIGDGWYDIVDTLCGLMSYKVETLQRRLKYAMENPDAKLADPISEIEKKLAEALEELPVFVQIKEKFGTMRFYVDGGTSEMHNYIEFAENMTGRTCEVCGDRGQRRSGGWIKVLCDKHAKEHNAGGIDSEDTLLTAAPTQLAPKIADE